MKREMALFFGNGLNRTLKGARSWGDLLNDITKGYRVDYVSENPMTLEFERIANQILSKEKTPSIKKYKEIKEKISSNMINAKLSEDSIHHLFMGLPIRDIITTNYDYLLEKAYLPEYTLKDYNKDQTNRKETKYSLNRRLGLGDKTFYHIHGEAERPGTICLGYEHYAGYLQKIISEMNPATNEPLIKKILTQKVEPTLCWPELFFTRDIHIVGFGLNQSEIDLWWVLTYRAYLYYSNYHEMKKQIKNKIIFYDIVSEAPKTVKELEICKKCDRPKSLNIQSVLEGLHVEYVEVPANGDYIAAYKEIYKQIEKVCHKKRRS